MSKHIHIVVSDLDGTLLPSQGKISKNSIETLNHLHSKNVIRVIATGRNLFSCLEILGDKFPIDYLIFASGAGIMSWHNKEIIFAEHLEAKKVDAVAKILITENIDFTIQETIPENHKFFYHSKSDKNTDFNMRVDMYKEFAQEIKHPSDTMRNASQLLAILPHDIELFEKLKLKFSQVKIIRATSPIDNKSIWMEFFPMNVSKAKASNWLCKKLNIDTQKSFVIGNDYNDVDLLDWGHHSYIVENAPEELKEKYNICPKVCQDGFSKAVNQIL